MIVFSTLIRFDIVLPVQSFCKQGIPFFIRLFRSVFLFPFFEKMKIIRQHLVAMIFFFLIFLLRCRLTNTRVDTGLLVAVIVKSKIFSKYLLSYFYFP